MSGEHGVKETKEVIVAANAVAAKVIELAKDGLDITDVGALVGDADLREKLKAAMEGVGNVPAEVKDLDWAEGLDLAKTQIEALPALLAAIRKKA